MSMRQYLEEMEMNGGLDNIDRRVTSRYEVAALTAQAQNGNALMFNDVEGGRFRVATNVVGTRERFATALSCETGAIHDTVISAIANSLPPTIGSAGTFMQNSSQRASELPIIHHFEKEPGPFITSSLVFVENPDTHRQNVSFHRMMPIDERRFTIRMVEGRHLHRCFLEARGRGEDLRVAVVVGVHPAVLIAAAYQAEWGTSEMDIANSLLNGGLQMARLGWSGLKVPADAEIVMEGRILHDDTAPERMVEMLRTYDHIRDQPIFELDTIHFRDKPIFHDILSGYGEHRLLMGMPVESKINGMLRGHHGFISASLTDGGCGWLHVVVRIQKGAPEDPHHIIHRAFEAHRSLKRVVVVDEDIDADDADSVEYAMATRFQADKDMVVISNVRGSSLDPSSDQKQLLTSKLGIDATIPHDKQPEGFEQARIPGMRDVRLADYIR